MLQREDLGKVKEQLASNTGIVGKIASSEASLKKHVTKKRKPLTPKRILRTGCDVHNALGTGEFDWNGGLFAKPYNFSSPKLRA